MIMNDVPVPGSYERHKKSLSEREVGTLLSWGEHPDCLALREDAKARMRRPVSRRIRSEEHTGKAEGASDGAESVHV
jgi:hypothetical protein